MDKLEAVDRADRWMCRVHNWFYDKTLAVGIDAWNTDPQLRVTRERSVRLLTAAAKKRERARWDHVHATRGTTSGRAPARTRS